MLEQCNDNCIDTDERCLSPSEIPCDISLRADCVIIGEDMNLCSIDVKSTNTLKQLISKIDEVLCGIKGGTIDIFYDNLDVVGSCIIKELIVDPITGKKTIKLSLDKDCIKDIINENPVLVHPFIISSSKYSICNNQSALLSSGFSNTYWYNQSGVLIGTGSNITVTAGGSYYGIRDGKVSNIINIVYTTECLTFSYTKVKSFYKQCPTGTSSSEYTHTKVYTSIISYQDALNKANLDSGVFDSEGQVIVNATGVCIGDNGGGGTPIASSCFNVFISNPNCNVVLPTPSPISPNPTPSPIGTPTVPTPIGSPTVSCNLSFSVSNITCTTIPSPTPTSSNVVDVFLFAGESNAGTRNLLSTASLGDLGLRSTQSKTIRILNNNNNLLEPINIAVNSSYGENDNIPNQTWGWEVPACNLFLANQLITQSNSEIVILKTAQGGAVIGQYNADIPGGYHFVAMSRINAVRNQLQLEGKTPKFHIFYSQGINNMIYPNIDDQAHFPDLTGAEYWKAATLVYLNELVQNTQSDVKICLTKFSGVYSVYNSKIDEIVASNPAKFYSVSTTDLTLQSDGLHWDAPSTKTLWRRMAERLSLTTVNVPSVSPTVNNLTITEPNRPAGYYRTDYNGQQYIYRYYLDMADNVYLENQYMKVGISLRGGGAITYLSKAGSTLNVVNNASDGGIGRQIQPDYYQKPTTFSVPGKATSVYFPNNGYNTTLGGDDFKNVPTLTNYYRTSDGYYLEFKPLVWGIDGHVSEIIMQVTYSLVGNTLKATYTYINERTDNQIVIPDPQNPVFDGNSIPTLHMNKFFTKLYTYEGNSLFANSPYVVKDIASNAKNTSSPQFTTAEPTEHWCAIEAPSQNFTLGITNSRIGYLRTERKNLVNENLANDGDDATTILELLDTTLMVDSRVRWVRTDDVYYTIGSVEEVRAKAYQVQGH